MRHYDPRLGQHRVGRRVIGVFRDRFIEVVDRFPQVSRGTLIPEKAALEIKLIGFRIRRRLFRELDLLRAGQLHSQRVGDGFCNLGFDREDVGQLPVEGVGPKCASVAVWISWTLTRTWSFAFCTLPSRMCATPSC